MTEYILEKFSELAKIPRPSHHEEQVSAFLKNWAEGQSFPVEQDDTHNLVIEVPAAKGCEHKPLVILQGHMDMVFAVRDGLKPDPYTTEITVRNDGTFLTSDGRTSLGADDGIGIAIMECVAEGYMEHGPLRLIITTDEEAGMTGAKNLDSRYVADAAYLINLDNEAEGEAVISSASGITYEYSRSYAPAVPRGDVGVELFLYGLTGGHSGDDIDKGRLNGILGMGELLGRLRAKGIDFELSGISGGMADNAIPTSTRASLCIAKADYDAVTECCRAVTTSFGKSYGKTDPELKLAIMETEKPDLVITAGETDRILRFTEEITDGVYSLPTEIDGPVESSSNIGMIEVTPEGFWAEGMIRSSVPEKEQEILARDRKLAAALAYDFKSTKTAMAWPARKNTRLQQLAADTYRELFDRELKLVAIHAGLECGVFAERNPRLDVIALGPTLKSPHSVRETLEIGTIDRVWRLLAGILMKI